MGRLNRDTLVAIFLLLFSGFAFAQTFAIPETIYNSMGAAVWPRLIIVAVSVLSLIYLGESLRDRESPRVGAGGGVSTFLRKYANAIFCYLLFGGFVLTLPYLGLLLSGLLFVFLMLTVLGERDLKHHLIHFAVSLITVVGLWSIFSFGLQVMLPEGVILRTL